MQLTDNGRQIVNTVAQRNGFSSEAVTAMLVAVAAGYGNQAQFNHPEFGGMGQWSSGGMIMIGDMFNNYLKGRVSALCQELSGLVQGQSLFAMPAQSQAQTQTGWPGQSSYGGQQQSQGGQNQGGGGTSLFVATANWWPSELGQAGSLGSQNNLRYAYFPGARRLAIDVNGQVSVYDTGQHQIGGFGQQQSGDQSLTFTSQFGLVRVMDLPIVSGAPVRMAADPQPAQPELVQQGDSFARPDAPVAPAVTDQINAGSRAGATPDDVFAVLEKLADLRSKGIVTDAEFETKKQDLLKRL
jgi:Short C-terminal domain